MAGFFDSIANYGAPAPMAVAGASNPAGAWLQAADPWAGMRESSVTAPGLAGIGGVGGTGLGFNLDTANLALGGLQTIGNLWQAWEANKLAKQQFKFQKDFANTNLANQIQSYNTTLEDRTRARTFTEGGTDAEAQAYIDANRLRRQ